MLHWSRKASYIFSSMFHCKLLLLRKHCVLPFHTTLRITTCRLELGEEGDEEVKEGGDVCLLNGRCQRPNKHSINMCIHYSPL